MAPPWLAWCVSAVPGGGAARRARAAGVRKRKGGSGTARYPGASQRVGPLPPPPATRGSGRPIAAQRARGRLQRQKRPAQQARCYPVPRVEPGGRGGHHGPGQTETFACSFALLAWRAATSSAPSGKTRDKALVVGGREQKLRFETGCGSAAVLTGHPPRSLLYTTEPGVEKHKKQTPTAASKSAQQQPKGCACTVFTHNSLPIPTKPQEITTAPCY